MVPLLSDTRPSYCRKPHARDAETGAILESRNVNCPTEVGDEFLADEIPLCAMNLLCENVLERAAGTRTHLGQLAEDDVVQGCKELVEVWRINVRREGRG